MLELLPPKSTYLEKGILSYWIITCGVGRIRITNLLVISTRFMSNWTRLMLTIPKVLKNIYLYSIFIDEEHWRIWIIQIFFNRNETKHKGVNYSLMIGMWFKKFFESISYLSITKHYHSFKVSNPTTWLPYHSNDTLSWGTNSLNLWFQFN